LSSADEVIGRVSGLIAQGDYLAAYDLVTDEAASALVSGGGINWIKLTYLRVLALARSGAIERAVQELDASGLEPAARAAVLPPGLAEDVAVLRARLVKDAAFLATGPGRQRLLVQAAAEYERVYRRMGRAYACINAATLHFLSGNADVARELARATNALVRAVPDDPFWDAATRAEAALVLEDLDACEGALRLAGDARLDDRAARAATRRQLTLLCAHLKLDPRVVLAPIANPDVVHFCGHMATSAERIGADDVGRVAAEIDRWVAARRIDAAWGALASGGDLLAAEALLRAAVPVHVVLPFGVDEFVDVSVRPAGRTWVGRFQECLAAAASVTITCDSGYEGDDSLFAFASRVAMGHVVNRARALTADAVQVAVWDGKPSDAPAGTAQDVAAWRALGHESCVIATTNSVSSAKAPPRQSRWERPIVGVVFGDAQGISRLDDPELLRFVEIVLGRVAVVLERFSKDVLIRNSWGDGIFIACTSIRAAALIALEIQESLRTVDFEAEGLPSDLTMRIAAHAGPVVSVHDPVRQAPGIFGRELTRAARIEPRTPPGEVYVASALAALLAVEPVTTPASTQSDTTYEIVPEYVGHVTTAKDFETLPLYVLRSRPG
jgi:hypothetical protein